MEQAPNPQHGPQPAYAPYPAAAPYVMMPVAQRNGLGAFGFAIALIGLFIPTGLVSILGLMLCLAALGRAPRGLAVCGVMLGFLGSIFWIVTTIVLVLAGLLAGIASLVVMAGAFALTQPEVVEVSADMVNVAIAVAEYEQEHDAMPESIGVLELSRSASTDPWGGAYTLVLIDGEPGFDVISNGADGLADTEDDIRLTTLDRTWELAFEDFDRKMEELGEQLEGLEGMHCHGSSGCAEGGSRVVVDYEQRAIDRIEAIADSH